MLRTTAALAILLGSVYVVGTDGLMTSMNTSSGDGSSLMQRGMNTKSATIRKTNSEPAPSRAEIEADDNITTYDKDDAGINAAKAKGRATLARFEELMNAGTPGNYTFKTGLPYGENSREHVWVQLTKRDGDAFHGLVANQPVLAKQYNLGDPIKVNRNEVSDWMVMSDTAIYGGYTMRHALDTLPKEQADHLRSLLKD